MKRLKVLTYLLFLAPWIAQSQTIVSTYAGSGKTGYLNGKRLNAKFDATYCIVFDKSGNLYLTDTHNERIRKVSATGTVTSIAGNGSSGTTDGKGSSAEFDDPKGICMDSKGNLYIVDALSYAIRKVTPSGNASTLVHYNVTAYCGVDIAIDSSDNLYLADNGANKIQKINTKTGKLTDYAGDGTGAEKDGSRLSAQFYGPNGIWIDKLQNIYVVDAWANSVRKITPAGMVSTIVASSTGGFKNGKTSVAKFNAPHSVIVDDNTGLIYVAEQLNNDIRVIDTVGDSVSTLAGSHITSGYKDGAASKSLLYHPHGMFIQHTNAGGAIDTTYLYFADCDNNVVRRININIISSIGNTVKNINLCSGTQLNIGDSTISGYTYNWYPTLNLSDSTVSNPVFGLTNNTSSNIKLQYIRTVTNGTTTHYDTVNVTVYPKLTQPTITKNADSLISSVANNYQWFYNNAGISGADLQMFIVKQSGYYKVEVSDSNGCIAVSNNVYGHGTDSVSGIITQSNSNALAYSLVYLLHFNAADTTVTVLDSTYTDYLGYYAFTTRDTLVYVLAFPDSANYPMEMPTYYDSFLTIIDGSQVSVHGGNNTVSFKTLHGTNPGGAGFISGKITICTLCKKAGGMPVAGLRVILINSSGRAVMTTKTNSKGYFSFSKIPVSKYSIWVDKPYLDNGKSPQVQLTSGKPQQSGLSFILHPDYLELSTTTGIIEENIQTEDFNIYPNPFGETAHLEYSLKTKGNVEILLTDIVGKQTTLFKGMSEEGIHQLDINSSELKLHKGIYILRITAGSSSYTQKLIYN